MSTATTIVNGVAVPNANANANPWEVKASSGGGGEGERFLCPAGNHAGMITALIHAGTVSNNFGESANTIILAYQLLKRREDGKPYVLADKYTFSLNTKANFRKVVESVIGRTLADGEPFDPRDLVGRMVLVGVKHAPSKDGTKTYDNIASIGPLPDGFPSPSVDQFDHDPIVWSVFDGIPFPAREAEWLPWVYGQSVQSIVENSAEVRARQTSNVPPPPGKPGSAYQPQAANDDIPY